MYTSTFSPLPETVVAQLNAVSTATISYQLQKRGIAEYTGTSSYHSGQLTLSRQRGAFTYTGAYTFSKALGVLAGDGGGTDALDVRNRNFGVLSYDRTHNLVVNYNWNMPRLIKRGGNRLLGGALNGWQLSGISSYQSGAPIRLSFGGGGTTTFVNAAGQTVTVTPTGNGLNGGNAFVSWWGTNGFSGGSFANSGGTSMTSSLI
jgi:hypothetical protein